MKKAILIIIPVLFLFSCVKNNGSPSIETITKGGKWNLKIGSSPEDVYSQLQLLGTENQFGTVSVVSRKPYSRPEDIKNLIHFYDYITLQSDAAVVDRVLIRLVQDKVSSIESGGGMLDSISNWPQDIPDDETIKVNDQTDEVYQKLLGIYQIPEYSNYQLIFPDKPLDRSYDPDMGNYDQWAFEFTKVINAGTTEDNSVRLYFENGKLAKIVNEYSQRQMVQ